MKKITLLAAAFALFGAANAAAQVEEVVDVQVQEIQYVEDPTQGLLLNRFKDNWFITAQGGINVYFSDNDTHRDFKDRFQGNAALYVGKWFSPVWGARIGADFILMKELLPYGLGDYVGTNKYGTPLYKSNHNAVGPVFDIMANLTNLFCGYKQNRIYNFVLYMGAGGYWTLSRLREEDGSLSGYKNCHDKVLTFRAGFINSFNLSRNVQLFLDLRASALDGIGNRNYENRTWLDVQAYLGLNFLINNRPWSHPVVPVCPPAENCDALRARLAAADARIADLEEQLRNALNRPAEVIEVVEKAPLATIYYPINVYRLTREDKNVLGAVANVMKDNPNTTYKLTGWADNYTGNDVINVRLRHNRVNGVFNYLTKNCGVNASQLTTTINNGNLCDLGEKFVALDRATTIEEE